MKNEKQSGEGAEASARPPFYGDLAGSEPLVNRSGFALCRCGATLPCHEHKKP